MTVRIPYTNVQRLIHRRYDEVRVELIDGRQRTAEQLRMAWAIMSDIALALTGDKRNAEEDVYRPLAVKFRHEAWDCLSQEAFHLSEATVTEATAFINYLVDICLEWEIPLSQPLYKNVDDIAHYVWSCAVHKKCAVCGQKAEIHHVESVGMGRDRTEICHIGMKAISLCRGHHQEAHQIGNDRFMSQYHLEPTVIDEKIAKVYHLKGETV